MHDFLILPPGKTAARSALLTARRARSAEELAAAANRVGVHLASLVREIAPDTIAAYSPFGTEPGGDLIGRLAALAPTAALLVPVTRPDSDLDWAAPGTEKLLGLTAVSAAQLVVVPALAVDRTGLRLGRGGGSYDRALARVAPSALIVALLHDGELAEAVPAEPHDHRVHAAITPALGTVWFTTAGL